MKIIHTGDLHIGESFKLIPNDYLNRQKQMLDEISNICKDKKADLLVISGDIFHTKKPTIKERDLFLKFLLDIDKLKMKTIILPGNHDRLDNELTNLNSFEILFNYKKFKNISIINQKPIALSTKESYTIIVPDGFNIRKSVKKLIETINKKDKFLMAFAHGAIDGSVSDTGRVLKGENLGTIKEIDYFGLGDIHKFQKVANNVYYCGAPIQHTFGDKLPKGVIFIDSNKKKVKLISLNGIKPFVTIRENEKIPKDCYVRIIAKSSIIDKLPDNVVKVTSFAEIGEDKEVDWDNKTNITIGLSSFLKKKGLCKKERKMGKKIIKGIVK